jgi:predicted Zn-dependent peptidase
LIDEYVYGFHHPYGKYTSTLDYEALEKEELVKFYQQFYTNGKCMIFVAGKLPTDIQEQLNNNFGKLPFNTTTTSSIEYNVAPAIDKNNLF